MLVINQTGFQLSHNSFSKAAFAKATAHISFYKSHSSTKQDLIIALGTVPWTIHRVSPYRSMHVLVFFQIYFKFGLVQFNFFEILYLKPTE